MEQAVAVLTFISLAAAAAAGIAVWIAWGARKAQAANQEARAELERALAELSDLRKRTDRAVADKVHEHLKTFLVDQSSAQALGAALLAYPGVRDQLLESFRERLTDADDPANQALSEALIDRIKEMSWADSGVAEKLRQAVADYVADDSFMDSLREDEDIDGALMKAIEERVPQIVTELLDAPDGKFRGEIAEVFADRVRNAFENV